MNKSHSIIKSINVLNVVLILIVAAVAYEVLTPFFNLNMKTVLPSIRNTDRELSENRKPEKSPSSANYGVVSEQNLFHPERRIPPEKEKKVEREVTVSTVVVPKPELVLYGTLITDTVSIAYVEDKKAPYSTPGRGTRQRQLKKGDSINGYVLQEIAPDRIILVKDADRLVVSLNDKDKARGKEATATVSLASSSPGSGVPPRSAVPTAPSAGGRPAAATSSPAASDQSTGYRSSSYFPAISVSPATSAPASQTGGSQPSTNPPATATPPAPSAGTGTSPVATNPPATNPPASDPGPYQPQYTAPPPGVAQMIEKLPPRSHALSDMLTITPNEVRKALGSN